VWFRSTSSARAATSTRSCAIPTRRRAAAITPATRWRSPTCAAPRLHFDAEDRSSRRLSPRLRSALRMPYRPVPAAAVPRVERRGRTRSRRTLA
jgi:hypothetical protein